MNILKDIVISLWVSVVLFQTVATMGFIVQFKINQSYYAEVLCINKNRPELACEGKCVLMQKMQKTYEEHEQKQSRTLQQLLEQEWAWSHENIKATIFLSAFNRPTIYLKIPSYFLNRFSQISGKDFFHPPILA